MWNPLKEEILLFSVLYAWIQFRSLIRKMSVEVAYVLVKAGLSSRWPMDCMSSEKGLMSSPLALTPPLLPHSSGWNSSWYLQALPLSFDCFLPLPWGWGRVSAQGNKMSVSLQQHWVCVVTGVVCEGGGVGIVPTWCSNGWGDAYCSVGGEDCTCSPSQCSGGRRASMRHIWYSLCQVQSLEHVASRGLDVGQHCVKVYCVHYLQSVVRIYHVKKSFIYE